MRAFYDLHILSLLHGQSIVPAGLSWHTVMESIRSPYELAQEQEISKSGFEEEYKWNGLKPLN